MFALRYTAAPGINGFAHKGRSAPTKMDADPRKFKWERSAVNESTTSTAPKVDPDKAAAHQFLSELNTRIATQPLPYQYGVDARALESLWELFGHTRKAINKYPYCKVFAKSVPKILNQDV